MARSVAALFACLLFAGGCGSGPDAAEPGGGARVVSAGSGGSAADAAAGGTGGAGAVASKTMHASFVAESKAGAGPALVSFVNDTNVLMSLWLGQATFIAVPQGETVGPALAASAAVEDDTTAGEHVEGQCVQFRLKKYVGPAGLTPGKHYSMNVTYDAVNGFVGTLTEVATYPFVAVRAEIHVPITSTFEPAVLTLELSGQRGLTTFSVYNENPTQYFLAGPGAFSTPLAFVDRHGKRFTSTAPVSVSGAPGFTVVVSEDAVSGATVVVPLHEGSK